MAQIPAATLIPQVTEKTMMPLSLVTALAGALLAAGMWLQTSLSRIETRLIACETRFNDSLTYREMQIWVMELREKNPRLVVPTLIHK